MRVAKVQFSIFRIHLEGNDREKMTDKCLSKFTSMWVRFEVVFA